VWHEGFYVFEGDRYRNRNALIEFNMGGGILIGRKETIVSGEDACFIFFGANYSASYTDSMIEKREPPKLRLRNPKQLRSRLYTLSCVPDSENEWANTLFQELFARKKHEFNIFGHGIKEADVPSDRTAIYVPPDQHIGPPLKHLIHEISTTCPNLQGLSQDGLEKIAAFAEEDMKNLEYYKPEGFCHFGEITV
jgi:hypothetical protein